jgi:excisionase family DNA binding protein
MSIDLLALHQQRGDWLEALLNTGVPTITRHMIRGGQHEWLTVAEAQARFLGGKLSLRTWYRAAANGTLPCVKVGGTILFRAADLDELETTDFRPKQPEPEPPPPPKPILPKPPTLKTPYRFFPPKPRA